MAGRGMAVGMKAGQRNCPFTPAPGACKPVLRAAGEAVPVLLPTLVRSMARRKTCRCWGAGRAGRGVACKPLLQPRAKAVRTTGRTQNEPERPHFGKANKGKVWGGEGGRKPAWIWSWRKFLAEQQEARGACPPHDSSWHANCSQQPPHIFWEGFV